MVPAPAPAPHQPHTEPGSQGGPRAPWHFGTWGCMSPAVLSSPSLPSSKAPDPRVPVTAGGGSLLPQVWKTTWKQHQEKEKRSRPLCDRQSPTSGREFVIAEPRGGDPKPNLGSAGQVFLTLQDQVTPIPSPTVPRSQQRRPQLPAALTTRCWGSRVMAITLLLFSLLTDAAGCLTAQEVPAKAPEVQISLEAQVFRRQE